MLDFARRLSRPSLGRVAIAGLAGGMMVATLFYALIWFIDVQPLAVISENISKADFLAKKVSQYKAVKLIIE